jgi:hypothetical protein
MTINLGVVGTSIGNGHPYSWSAIINGYNTDEMEKCGFPVIPRYLEKQSFPADTIKGAKVSHVWAQDKNVASHIARAALIDNVVENYVDMIDQVDGVLLARDDAVTRIEFAEKFLDAGLPVYIDKPLALSVAEANKLIDRQKYRGQLFSCSALRYAKEFQLSRSDRSELGPIRQIHATVPKSWDKYAVHVIEPALLMVTERGSIENSFSWGSDNFTTLAVQYESDLQLLITTSGTVSAPIAIRVMGDLGWKDYFFQDTFFAFKCALNEFILGIEKQDVRIEPNFMLEVVELIEVGNRL